MNEPMSSLFVLELLAVLNSSILHVTSCNTTLQSYSITGNHHKNDPINIILMPSVNSLDIGMRQFLFTAFISVSQLVIVFMKECAFFLSKQHKYNFDQTA